MAINENIRKYRKERSLTLEEVGKAVGVSKQTIQRYENGQITTIPYDKILLLAKTFNIRPEVLMGWDTPASSVLEAQPSDFSNLSSAEQDMLSDYRTLNDLGQQEATKRVHELTLIPSYVEDQFFGHPIEDNDLIPVAAHHQPGINGTEENALEEVERLRGKYGKKD